MSENDQVAKLLGQLRNAMAEHIVGLNRSLEAEEQSVTARVEQRKQLTWQLQLPNRLFTIYLEVENYPVWAQNRPEDICSLITEIDALEQRETRRYQVEKQVQFSRKGHRYSLVVEEHLGSAMPGEYDTCYTSLTLAGSNGDVLFDERMSCPRGLGPAAG